MRASRSLTQRRRLRDEETNFRKLLDEVRFTLAKEMLQQDLTVEQVAERAGYAEPLHSRLHRVL